jgi:hypothetical protein
MSNSELDKTIEELEAEVIAELDEASKQPNDSGLASEKGSKIEGEVQDLGPAVVSPDAKSDPGKEVSKKAKPIKGDAQQKGSKKAEAPKKLAAGDDLNHDGEQLEEKSSADKKEMINAMVKKMEGMSAKQLSAMVDNGAGDEDEDETHAVDEAKREAVESRIKDIDVAEDVEALMQDEDELSEEFKVKAATIFEAAVKSKVRDEVERIADELSSDKQKEVGTFKEELSDKVDDYLNYEVEERSKQNELAIERGLKGEIAEDFINGLQQLFTDHYIDVPNERYDVLEAQSDKISDLEDKLNEVLEKSVKLKESNDVYMREQVIIEVSDDLADTEVEKFKSLTEDVDFVSEDKFREKLETIKENYFPKVSVETAELDDEIDGSGQTVDTTGAMKSYMSAITRNQQRAQ